MTTPSVTVITGANSGIGLDAAHRIAAAGGTVVLLCRTHERGEPARSAVEERSGNRQVHLITADLASLAQVRSAAREIAERWPRITALVNNAGLAKMRNTITEDGFELTFQVNHLAHFLLTHLLLDPLREGRGRVVNLASEAHRRGRLDREPLEKLARAPARYRGLQAYCDSKLANVLFTAELARRGEGWGVTANALHPGTLSTAIWDRNPGWKYWAAQLLKLFMEKPDVGGAATARLVLDPELAGVSGRYFDRLRQAKPSRRAQDDATARALWEFSARAVGLG